MALNLELLLTTGSFIINLVIVGIILGVMGVLDGKLWKGWIFLLVAICISTIGKALEMLNLLYIFNAGIFITIAGFLFAVAGLIFVIYMQKTFEDTRKVLRR